MKGILKKKVLWLLLFVWIWCAGRGELYAAEQAVTEPELATVEDSVSVNYQVIVRVKDRQTQNPLAGCVIDIYEEERLIATATTNRYGLAYYRRYRTEKFQEQYCTNFESLSEEQKAELSCFASKEEAQQSVSAQKREFQNAAQNFVCKQKRAPQGYLREDEEQTLAIFAGDSEIAEYTNERVLGTVTIECCDTESEGSTVQGEGLLDGAVYGIYAAEDIVHQDKGTGVLWQKDQLVMTGTIGSSPDCNEDGYLLNTDGSRHIENPDGTVGTVQTPGKTTFADLELGAYYVKELTPAQGYLRDETIYNVTLAYQDQYTKVVSRSEHAGDDRNTLTSDDESDSKTIYSGNYVMKQGIRLQAVTGESEKADDMEGAGFCVYLLKELSGVVEGTWSAQEASAFESYDFRGEAKARLYRRSEETWTAGDMEWLSGLGENRYEVAEMFMDANGCLETPELPYGTYVIVQTTVPEGCIRVEPFIAEISQDGGVLYTDETRQTVEKTYTAEDAIRYGDRKESGTREGRISMTQELQYTYIARTRLRVVNVDEEFLIQPKSGADRQGRVRGTVLKEGAQYRLKCRKLAECQKNLKALCWNYDEDGYLSYGDEQEGSLENPFRAALLGEAEKLFDCYITLPQELPVGVYELQEITAPQGYVVSGSEQSVQDTGSEKVNDYQITDDARESVIFTIDHVQQDQAVTVFQKNQAQKGILEITLYGRQLADAKKMDQDTVFSYEDAPVEGAKLQIVAAEDIYTQELDKELIEQYDLDLADYLLYRKDDVVAEITTDCNGWGYAMGLYIGSYRIVEKTAGEGFVLNKKETAFEITPQKQTVSFDIHTELLESQRQELEIHVKRTGGNDGEAVADAVYGLYAAEEIVTRLCYDEAAAKWELAQEAKALIEKDQLVACCKTDDMGKAVFPDELPLGKYYVKELQAPQKAAPAKQTMMVDASYQGISGGQNVEKQVYHLTFTDEAVTASDPSGNSSNGAVTVVSASEQTQPAALKLSLPVKTADVVNGLCWCITMAVSGAALVIVYRKKRAKKVE